MDLNAFLFGIACFSIAIAVTLIAVATYYLLPIPLLSYQQGNEEQTGFGKVVYVRVVRKGITEVMIRQELNIDPALQQPEREVVVSSVGYNYFVYIRGTKNVPEVGNPIEVTWVNRYYRLTEFSYKWVKTWKLHEGELPKQGSIRLVRLATL